MLSAEIILINKSIFHCLKCPGEETMPKINCHRIFADLTVLHYHYQKEEDEDKVEEVMPKKNCRRIFAFLTVVILNCIVVLLLVIFVLLKSRAHFIEINRDLLPRPPFPHRVLRPG